MSVLVPHRSITKTVVSSEIRREIGENQKVFISPLLPSFSHFFQYNENTQQINVMGRANDETHLTLVCRLSPNTFQHLYSLCLSAKAHPFLLKM